MIEAYSFTAPKIHATGGLFQAAARLGPFGTLPGYLLGGLESPRDSAISNPVPMSSDRDNGRYVTWKFKHILHTSLNGPAIRGLSTSIDPYDLVKQLFQTLIMTNRLPDRVASIQLRVSRADFDACVSNARAKTPMPDLPFDGYIQAPGQIDRNSLLSWFHATWERVNGKLISHEPYRKGFLSPDSVTAAAFVYFQLHGVPAVKKGGRPPNAPAVNCCSPSCVDNAKLPCCISC